MYKRQVIDTEKLSNQPAMTYAYYHNNIKGKAPKNAPTYRGSDNADNIQSSPTDTTEYVCEVCKYVYRDGDFENLPDNWVCPICGVPKNRFKPKIN